MGINVGLHHAFAPPQRLVSDLPYVAANGDNWHVAAGEWTTERGLVQSAPGFGLVAAPLRLEGGARIHAQVTAGTGISFDTPDPNAFKTSQLVYVGRDGVVAGALDDRGRLTVAGRSGVSTGERFAALTILLEEDSYSVWLDHEPVLGDLPRSAAGGGLNVFGTGTGALAGLSVDQGFTRAGAAPVAETEQGFQARFDLALEAAWHDTSGTWQVADGRLHQRDSTGFNHSLLFPYDGAARRVSLELDHLSGFGGGLVFHMPSQTGVAGGHLVRFNAVGEHRELFWGYFDTAGSFVAQGDAPVDAAGRLEVVIGAAHYDVLLAGEVIARQIPLVSAAGFVGVTSSQSAVAFTTFEVSEQ